MGFYYHIEEVNVIISDVTTASNILRKAYPEIDASLTEREVIQLVAHFTNYSVEVQIDGSLVVNEPSDSIKGSDGTDWIRTIASCVKENSYVQVRNDDDDLYRVLFYEGDYFVAHPVWPSKKEVINVSPIRIDENTKKWMLWDNIVSQWENSEGSVEDAVSLRLDWARGAIVQAPCPGVEWSMDMESPLAIRVPTGGLTPLQLVEFGAFCVYIPDSWSSDPEPRTYIENGIEYIEVCIYPD